MKCFNYIGKTFNCLEQRKNKIYFDRNKYSNNIFREQVNANTHTHTHTHTQCLV